MITNRSKKILFVLFIPIYLLAQTGKFSEFEVKAAFLEKFTRFIEWPGKFAIPDTNKPFVLGIIGENPFESILEKMYSKQTIKGKKVEIRYISTLNAIADCNLLFISQSENNRIGQILSYTRKKPILTVSDYKEYSKKGILITLFVESGHVYFNINQNAAQQSGLYISSLLFNMSKAVYTEENE